MASDPKTAAPAAADAAAAEATPENAQEEFVRTMKEQGNLAFKGGDYHSAIRLYSLGLGVNPHTIPLLNNRSMALSRVERYQEALADARTALKVDDTGAKQHFRLSLALLSMGRVEEAAVALTAARAKFPDEAALQTLQRQAHGQMQKLETLGQMFNSIDRYPPGMPKPAPKVDFGDAPEPRREGLWASEADAASITAALQLESAAVVELPGAPSADADLDARLQVAAQCEAAACALIGRPSPDFAGAARALARGLRALQLKGRVDPADRRRAELAKVPLLSLRSACSLAEGEWDEAETDASRVLSRVRRTEMGAQYILRSGRASSSAEQEQQRSRLEREATFRDALALLEEGDAKAAVAEWKRLYRLAPEDPMAAPGLSSALQALEDKKLKRAQRKAGGDGGSDADDSDDSEEEEEEEEEEEKEEDEEADEEMRTAQVFVSQDVPAQGVPVLILTDTEFRLSDRICKEFVVGALLDPRDAKTAQPIRPRVVDYSQWRAIDWSLEQAVVVVVGPLRGRGPRQDGKDLIGMMRWIVRERPPLGHIRFSVAAAGNSQIFGPYDQPARWLHVALSCVGGMALTPMIDIDTAQGRAALSETCQAWVDSLADRIENDARQPAGVPPGKAATAMAGLPALRPVTFDYLPIRLQGKSPPTRLHRLRPIEARVVTAGALGSGADASLCAVDLEVPKGALPLIPGDAVGVIVPNTAEDVDAVLGLLGVDPDTPVQTPAWAFETLRVPDALAQEEAGWEPAAEDVELAAAAAAPQEAKKPAAAGQKKPGEAADEDEERDPREVVAAAERVQFGPRERQLRTLLRSPGRDTTPTNVVSLRHALTWFFDLQKCSPPLIKTLCGGQSELMREEGLVAAANGGLATLLRWAVAARDSYARRRAQEMDMDPAAVPKLDRLYNGPQEGIPASELADSIARCLQPRAAAVAAVTEGLPAATLAAGGAAAGTGQQAAAASASAGSLRSRLQVVLEGGSVQSLLAGLSPGAKVPLYSHPACFPGLPVDQALPLAVLMVGAGHGYGRALVYQRLHSKASGHVSAVSVESQRGAGVPFATELAGLDDLSQASYLRVAVAEAHEAVAQAQQQEREAASAGAADGQLDPVKLWVLAAAESSPAALALWRALKGPLGVAYVCVGRSAGAQSDADELVRRLLVAGRKAEPLDEDDDEDMDAETQAEALEEWSRTQLAQLKARGRIVIAIV